MTEPARRHRVHVLAVGGAPLPFRALPALARPNSIYAVFPGFVWNLGALSGVRVLGEPAEELPFTFGPYWSSLYEHCTRRRSEQPSGRTLRQEVA